MFECVEWVPSRVDNHRIDSELSSEPSASTNDCVLHFQTAVAGLRRAKIVRGLARPLKGMYFLVLGQMRKT